MSRYRTISIKMWGDERFLRLSRPQPNAQTLWIYLLTGPHTTALPGVFVAGEAGLAEALNWPIKAFRKAFAELLAEGMVKWDSAARLTLIPKALKHNPPQSPNVVIAWRKAFDDLPDCELKQTIFNVCVTELTALGKGEAFVKAFGKDFVYAFAESEQEQNRTVPEQEQNSGGVAAFGEFSNVVLSAEEQEKLISRFGHDSALQRIEALSAYLCSTGKKYRSHYATILNWNNRQGANGHGQPKENPNERAAADYAHRKMVKTVR